MKCKDCKYFHIKEPTGYSRAFCGHWLSNVGEIKKVIRKCEYYQCEFSAEDKCEFYQEGSDENATY